MSELNLSLLTHESVPTLTDDELFSLDELQLMKVDSNTVPGLLLKSKIRIEKMKRRDKQMESMIAEAKRSNMDSIKSLGDTIAKVSNTKQVNFNILVLFLSSMISHFFEKR
jgi:hypothetical protein